MSGLISGPIILFYIFICFFIFRYIRDNIEKKHLAKYFLIMMLTFPFWDLIIQKGIKTFVEFSGILEPKVFNFPEKEANGKLESLSLVNLFYFQEKMNHKIIDNLKQNINNFFEIRLCYFEKNNLKSYNIKYFIKDNSVLNIDKEDSRYRFKIFNNNILNLYNIKTYQLFDFKKEIIIAEYYELQFFEPLDFIRSNVFFLISGTGNSFVYVKNYSNEKDFDIILNKIVGDIK